MHKIFSKNNSSKPGFTLVELLVVIVVIAILASIAVVTYSGIQDKAKDSVTRSDLSNLDKKFKLYYLSSNELPAGESEMRGDGYDGIVSKMTININNLPYENTSSRTEQGEYYIRPSRYDVIVYYYNYADKFWERVYWSTHGGQVSQSNSYQDLLSPSGSGPCSEKYVEDCISIPT